MKTSYKKVFGKILLLSLFIILNVQIFLPVSVYSQTNSDTTQSIVVEVEETPNDLSLNYTIKHFFKNSSNGIGISLPLYQDGVRYDYIVESLKRRNDQLVIDPNDTELHLSVAALDVEPYDVINEVNEFSIRTGNPDRTLPLGLNEYKLELRAVPRTREKHQFTVIHNWSNKIENIEVVKNGENLCNSLINCDENKTAIERFEDNTPVNPLIIFISPLSPYVGAIFIVYAIIGLFWIFWKRGFLETNKKTPEFDPPHELKPWHFGYLMNKKRLNSRRILLSYLIWLHESGYVSFSNNSFKSEKSSTNLTLGKNEKKDIKLHILKPLPSGLEFLPETFNDHILLMEKEGGRISLSGTKPLTIQGEREAHRYIDDFCAQYLEKSANKKRKLRVLGLVFGILIIPATFVLLTREILFIGNSWIWVVLLASVSSLPVLLRMLLEPLIFNQKGLEVYEKAKAYYQYLINIEKNSPNFSLNPQQGERHYQTVLAFGTSIGLFSKLQSFITQQIYSNENKTNKRELYDSLFIIYSNLGF